MGLTLDCPFIIRGGAQFAMTVGVSVANPNSKSLASQDGPPSSFCAERSAVAESRRCVDSAFCDFAQNDTRRMTCWTAFIIWGGAWFAMVVGVSLRTPTSKVWRCRTAHVGVRLRLTANLHPFSLSLPHRRELRRANVPSCDARLLHAVVFIPCGREVSINMIPHNPFKQFEQPDQRPREQQSDDGVVDTARFHRVFGQRGRLQDGHLV